MAGLDHKPEVRTLGEELRMIRRRRKFSMRGLSDASRYANSRGKMTNGLARSTIKRIEDGSRANPSTGTLLILAELLNIEIRIWPDGLEIIDLEEEVK